MSKGQFKHAAERGAVTLTPFDIQVLNALETINAIHGDFVPSEYDACKFLGCDFHEISDRITESMEKMEQAGLFVDDKKTIRRKFRKAAEQEPEADAPQCFEPAFQRARTINHFKPHVDLMAGTVECEYVERLFMTEKERASMIAEAANDLDGVRDYLNEWFCSRVADCAGELPPSLEETMTALASINHVLDSFTNAGNLRTASGGRNGA